MMRLTPGGHWRMGDGKPGRRWRPGHGARHQAIWTRKKSFPAGVTGKEQEWERAAGRRHESGSHERCSKGRNRGRRCPSSHAWPPRRRMHGKRGKCCTACLARPLGRQGSSGLSHPATGCEEHSGCWGSGPRHGGEAAGKRKDRRGIGCPVGGAWESGSGRRGD